MTGPAYCILRTAKLTKLGNITSSAKHTFREIPTRNVDPKRTHLNRTWGAQNAAAVRAAVRARLPAKRRKDAVLCIEYLVTASPEWFKATPNEQKDAYFEAAKRWLKNRHGEANIVCMNLQLDEKSPHLVAYVVPLTKDGRLSAKDFLGGRKVLSEMQTEFASQVGKSVGLKRGIEGSRAIHTTPKAFNAALEKSRALPTLELPKPTLGERISGKAKKMEEEHAAAVDKRLILANQGLAAIELSRHARDQQADALEHLRWKARAAEQHEVDASRLRKENARLVRELQQQQTYFQQQIADLKALLTKAAGQMKELLTKVGLITRQRDSAEAEAEELREILYPAERRSRAAPGHKF
jgi:adenylate cyclase class IV